MRTSTSVSTVYEGVPRVGILSDSVKGVRKIVSKPTTLRLRTLIPMMENPRGLKIKVPAGLASASKDGIKVQRSPTVVEVVDVMGRKEGKRRKRGERRGFVFDGGARIAGYA